MGWSEIQEEVPDMSKLKNPYPRDPVKQLFRVEKANARMKLALIMPWVLFVVGNTLGYWLLFQPIIKRFDLLLTLDGILIMVSFFGGLFGGAYTLRLWLRAKDYYYGITEHEDLVCLINSASNSSVVKDMDTLMKALNEAIADGRPLDGFDTRIMKHAHIYKRGFLQVDISYVDFKDETFECVPLYVTNSGYESIMAILNAR